MLHNTSNNSLAIEIPDYIKPYEPESYSNRLLLLERDLMIKALRKSKGKVKKAYKLNCPIPCYSFSAYKVKLIKHRINFKEKKLWQPISKKKALQSKSE